MKCNNFQHLLALIIAVGLIFAVSACASGRAASSAARRTPIPTTAEDGTYLGEVITPPLRMQDFVLPSSQPEITRLSDLNGQWRLIFFGYLHCPDFCPMTLSEYRQVKRLLGADEANVTFIYISMDAARDTPEAIRDYLANFDTAFVGFSGDDATLARIQPDYGFYYRRRVVEGSRIEYVVDHSTRTYLLDREGYLRSTFTYDTEPETVAAAIAWYIAHEGA